MVLPERNDAREHLGIDLSWEEMHRSFCILQKQTSVPVHVFSRLWGLTRACDGMCVVAAFAGVGLAYIVASINSEETYVRLHDLVHDFSTVCSEREGEIEIWHRRCLERYIPEADGKGGLRDWWAIEDDGYVYENVCRHLAKSDRIRELTALLLNVNWAKCRLRRGGIRAWKMDFCECMNIFGSSSGDEEKILAKSLVLVRDAVSESWPVVSDNAREFGFQVEGRLWGCEEWPVQKFLESMRHGSERPRAMPLGPWWEKPSNHGLGGKFTFDGKVMDTTFHEERNMVVAAVDCDIVVIDIAEMQVVRTYAGGSYPLETLSISRSGDLLYGWSSQDGMLRVWKIETGEEVRVVQLKYSGSTENSHGASCAAIHPDSNFVVTGSENGIVSRWDVKSGEQVGKGLCGFAEAVHCVATSRDGRSIAAGGESGSLMVWDIAEPQKQGFSLSGHKSAVMCLVFSADGSCIASGSFFSTFRFPRLYYRTLISDISTGAAVVMSTKGSRPVGMSCVAFSHDGKRIVTGGRDHSVRIFDTTDGSEAGLFRAHTGMISCVKFARKSQLVISASHDGTVCVQDLSAIIEDANIISGVQNKVYAIDVSPKGHWFISGSVEGKFMLWDGATGQQIGQPWRSSGILLCCIAVSPCGKQFVCVSSESLQVWDIENRCEVGEKILLRSDLLIYKHCERMDARYNVLHSVVYSPNGQFIVYASELPIFTIRVWHRQSNCEWIQTDVKVFGEDCPSIDSDSESMSWLKVSTDPEDHHTYYGLRDGKLYSLRPQSRTDTRSSPRSYRDTRLKGLQFVPELSSEEHTGVSLKNDRILAFGSSGMHLVTCPRKIHAWSYNVSQKVIGVILEDCNLFFLKVEI